MLINSTHFQYAELEAKRTELNDLQQQQQALADHYAPHNILARLKIAASEAEDETEVRFTFLLFFCV